MLREIVLDTETTGTDAKNGDRLIEIGCVELINHIQTGVTFHRYVNPTRPVSQGAFGVHGLSDAFLADKPVFSAIVDDFVAFCGDSPLVIHNAPFDVGFLNMEFARLGEGGPPQIALETVVDTLQMARRKHTGASNTLDALCVRYGIDTTRRTKHGALLDAQILAEVYIELLGGKQTSLGLAMVETSEPVQIVAAGDGPIATGPRRLRNRLNPLDVSQHAAFVSSLSASPIWRDYVSESEGE